MRVVTYFLLLPLLGFTAREGDVAPVAQARQAPDAEWNPDASSVASPALPHDLHASYGHLGVEGSLAILELRIFKDDLEEALGRMTGHPDLVLEVTPEMDALFLEYLKEHFVLEVGGRELAPAVVGSGYDELDREPVWTYQVRYDAPAPIRAARLTNTILFEVFDDQRNVVRVVAFPSERRSAYYFAPGEATREITFGG